MRNRDMGAFLQKAFRLDFRIGRETLSTQTHLKHVSDGQEMRLQTSSASNRLRLGGPPTARTLN